MSEEQILEAAGQPVSSARWPLAPARGQTWRHAGGNGVPGTGLRVRIVGREQTKWLCIYPDHPERNVVGYTLNAFSRFYELDKIGPGQKPGAPDPRAGADE